LYCNCKCSCNCIVWYTLCVVHMCPLLLCSFVCCALFEHGGLFCVVSYCITIALVKTPFVVKINNNNNNNNTEKTKCMLLSRHQNAGQNHDIKIANSCFENVAQFRYLGTTITNQIMIQEEIKKRLNSGNGCYHSIQKL
jgi:hypothetical protein